MCSGGQYGETEKMSETVKANLLSLFVLVRARNAAIPFI